MRVIILWAMSLWGAAVVLVGTGYGSGGFTAYGIRRASMVVLGVLVWGLGWWAVRSVWPGVRLDIGLLLLAAFGAGLVFAFGDLRWWFITSLLAVLATMIRMLAPVMTHQAEVMPVATIESLGLGVAAGLSLAEPLPASSVAALAEALAAVVIAWQHPHIHDVGRHDMAMAMLAALSAWMVGWVVNRLAHRFHRMA